MNNSWANYQFVINATGQVQVGLRINTNTTAYTFSSDVISVNQWFHITMSWSSALNSGLCRIYIDGKEVAYQSQNALTSAIGLVIPESTKIGSDIHAPFEAFDGTIDDIGIWNRALTQCEISALYYATVLTLPVPDLGSDTLSFCGATGTLDAGAGYAAYSWNTGDTTQTIAASTMGDYSVMVTDTNGCTAADTVLVSIIDPTITPTDTTICLGDSVELSVCPTGNSCIDLPANLQNGLVAKYFFCGNANDESGNGNDGTVNGAILTTDRFCQPNSAYSFDGIDDFISMPNAPFVNGPFTISGWMKYNVVKFNPFVGLGELGGTYLKRLYFIPGYGASGRPGIGTAGANDITSSDDTTTVGVWHHTVVVFNSYNVNGVQFYVDGNLLGANTTQGANVPFPLNNVGFTVGLHTGSGPDYADADIDDIGMWNRALDSTEIQQLYTLGQYDISWSTGDTTASITVSPSATTTYSVAVSDGISSCSDSVTVTVSDPQVNLGDTISACGDSVLLDAGSGYNYYSWSTGESTQTIYASATGDYAATVGDSVGVNNDYSLSFDGVDDYVDVNNTNAIGPTTSSDFSISLWVKVSSIYGNIISIYDNLNSSNSNFYLGFNGTNNFRVTGNGTNVLDFGTPILNTWYYISIVFQSNGDVNAYNNGTLAGTSNLNLNSSISTVPISFGKVNGSFPGFLEGEIDQVSIWDFALDSTQIQTYMNCPPTGNEAGLVGYWNFEEGTGTTTADQTSNGNDGTLTNGPTWSTDVPSQTCISCTATDSVYVSLVKAEIEQPDTAVCVGDSVNFSVCPTGNTCMALPSNLQTGLVAHYPFCGNANDESGNGNDGTVNGAMLTTDRFCNENSAYYFDGVDDYIEVSISNDLLVFGSNQLSTISFDFTITDTNLNHSFISFGNHSTTQKYIAIEFEPPNKINATYYLGNWIGQGAIATYSFENNKNYHIDVVRGDSLMIYINGNYSSVPNVIFNNSYNGLSLDYNTPISSYPLRIGARNENGPNWPFMNGIMDNVTLWNRALDSTEIQQLYTLGQYDISWSTGDTTASITVSPSATTTYSVAVSDGISSCMDSVTVTVSDPAIAFTTTDVSCNGYADGTAAATATNGVAPYSYSWSTTATTSSISGLAQGTYTVDVADSIGCSKTDSTSISEPTALSVTPATTDVSCNGGTDGTATLAISGGTAPYTIDWGVLDTNALPAGTHTYIVTDDNSCSVTDSVTVSEPSALSVIPTTTDVSCNGLTDGTATLAITGGTAPYTIDWGVLDTNALSAGTHGYTVSDSKTCSVTDSVTITESALLSVTPSTTDVSCNGLTDGTATLAISGGTAPYNIDWGSADTNALPAGTYPYTITDTNSCSATDSITITEPDTLSVTPTTANVSCNGLSDGTATLAITGGTTPYNIDWGTADTNALPAGTYPYTVTDTKTCSLTDSITISEPATLTATATTTDVSCKGGTDGTASLSLSGGTAPYVIDWGFVSPLALPAGLHAYTITDDNGCTFTDTVSITEPTALQHSITTTDVLCNGETTGTATLDTTGGTPPYTIDWQGQDPAALSAGNYIVLVTDANGCDSTLSYTIAEPTALTLDTSITNTTCNGFTDGSITISTTGGTAPYSYSWSTGAATSTLTSLGAGTYSVTVTDDNGCTDSITATITDPALFAVTISGDGTLCQGDSTVLTADNGDTFSWFTGESTQDIIFYPSKDTLAWVTAMEGPCSASDTMALTVYPLTVVYAGADTIIDYGTTITLNSNAVGTYYWYPADGLSCTSCESPVASPETDITYYLEVTDSNGCVALDSIIITVNFETDPFVANIFSPNGDGLNDILHVNGLTGDDFLFRIYDRWGNILFESSDQGQGWDGSSAGKLVNSGEYVYTYSFKDNNGNSIKGHGSVTLVR